MNGIEVKSPEHLSQGRRLSFLMKDSILYGGAAAFSKATALLTFPILTRHFSVEEYGIVDLFLVLSTLLTTAYIFGQDSSVARYIYEYENIEERRQIISQSLTFQFICLIFSVPLFIWGFGQLARMIAPKDNVEILFITVVLQLPFLILVNFSQGLLKWTFEREKYLIMSLGYGLLHGLLLAVGVLVLDIGIHGVLIVSLVASAIFGGLGVYFIREWLTRPIGFGRLREMLPFAIPYGIIGILGALTPILERYLTRHLLGAEELGLYAAGARIALLMSLLVGAFQTAWGPFSLAIHRKADAIETYNQVLKVFSLGICVAVLLLGLVAQQAIQVLATDRYIGSMVVILPNAMAIAIQATSWITEVGIGLSKRSSLNIIGFLVATGSAVISINILAPQFGLVGVALGVLVSYMARAFILSMLAQRVYPLPWQYRGIIAVHALTMLVCFVALWMGSTFSGYAYITTLIIGLISILGISWFMLFSSVERQSIFGLMLDLYKNTTARLR